MAFRTVSSALVLGLLLAGCEGDRIGPPDPNPGGEDTVQLDEPAILPPAEPESDEPQPAPPPVDEQVVAPPVSEAEIQEGMREASEEARQRAQEIFEEVLGDTPDETPAPPPPPQPEPQPQPAQPAPQSQTFSPGALLTAPSTLQPDTLEAARYDASGSGLDYVGAWASRAGDCDLVDQPPFEDFAVITPTGMRIAGVACTIDARPLQNASASVPATCAADGVTQGRLYSFEMADAASLRITEAETGFDGSFVRCGLPG